MGIKEVIPESTPEIVSSQPSVVRRKLFGRLLALAGLGITGVLLSQEKTGLLPTVDATQGAYTDAGSPALEGHNTAFSAPWTGVLGLSDGGIGVAGVSNGSSSTSIGVLGNAGVSTAKAIVAQGASGQSANLQEWQNSSALALSAVKPNGDLIAPQVGQNSPNVTYASPSNPASFTNAMNVSGSAMEADGLAIHFTPKLTGNVLVTAAVDLFSTNPAFGTFAAVWYGTGTAPSFGATLPSGGVLVPPYRGSGYNPTALFPVYIPGLTVGTQYWFDLGHAVNAGGNGSHFNIAYTIIEI